MAQNLCHVCGRPTSQRDRHIFPAQTGGFVTLPDGSERYANNIPPVHLACARRAQTLCPHLRHEAATPVRAPDEAAPLLPRTDILPGLEELARTLPPHLKIVFSCYRLHSARFTAQVRRLRS